MDENILLVKKLSGKQVLKSPKVVNAFIKIDRRNFVGMAYEANAYDDKVLPTGAGQNMSEPSTVAFMLELLQLEPGQRVLDVGSGSGWTTALIAEIVGPAGKVVGIEVMPYLLDLSRRNILKTQLRNIEFAMATNEFGCNEKGPYDRIEVTASVERIPAELIEQLKVGGILVIPINNKITKVVKVSESELKTETFEGYFFDPIVHTSNRTLQKQDANNSTESISEAKFEPEQITSIVQSSIVEDGTQISSLF